MKFLKKYKALLLCFMSLFFMAGMCEKDTDVDEDVVLIKSITLDRTSAQIKVGKTLTLTATIVPDDATKKKLAWSSSDENVAIVENGEVTAIAEGVAAITAAAKDGSGKSASCVVTVTYNSNPDEVLVEEIALNKSYLELAEGETYTLRASVYPEDADNPSLTWTSSDRSVATVAKGKITAVSSGYATITASANDGSGVSASCEVLVIANGSEDPEDPETQWSEWAEYSTGTYLFTAYWEGTYPDVVIYHRESLTDPKKQQFALQNHPGYEMIIDYDAMTGRCHVNVTDINYSHEEYGAMYVADSEIYAEQVNPDFLNNYETQPSFFDPEAGVFSLHLVYFVSEGFRNPDYEYLYLGEFTEPDYSISIEYLGFDENTASFYITKGTDVSTYKCAITTGTLGEEEALNTAWDIVNEEISSTESDESDYHNFRLTEAGEYTLVAVSFDETGSPQIYAWYNFSTSSGDQDSQWRSLGMAAYREDFITTIFDVENLTYEVEIQENRANPGLYRLVNPYGAAYPYNGEGYYDASEDHYMIIDAQDPSAVTIWQTYTGLDWGYGEMMVWSLADLYLSNGNATEEEIADAGFFGKLENGVITFPTKTLIVSMEELEDGGLFYANINGQFAVVLPGYYAPAEVPAAAPAQRATKKVRNAVKAIDRVPLKKRSTNMGIIPPHIRNNFRDIIR